MDSIEYLGATGTELSLNLFSYCENNLANYMDLYGYSCCKVLTLIVVATLTIIISVVNHIINEVNYSKINSELQGNYTREEAKK